MRLISPAAIVAGMGLMLLWGCKPAEETRTFSPEDNVTHADDHAHEHAHGPHEGHIVELGGEDYHAEVVLDAARKPTVYLLTSDLKTPLPVDAPTLSLRLTLGDMPQEFTLTAEPQMGDGEGKASQFTLKEGALPESIHDAEDLQGEVVVSISGTQYRGPISHDHEHEHEHEHAETPAAKP